MEAITSEPGQQRARPNCRAGQRVHLVGVGIDDMTCPTCNGHKRVYHPVHIDIGFTCPDCEGTGIADDRYYLWLAIGEAMKAERISRRVLLRDEAIARGMDVGLLSRMERGFNEPIQRQTA